MMDELTWMEGMRRQVDAWVDEDLRRPEPLGGRIVEAMRYSATVGGKRLRPLLILAAGQYVGLESTTLRLPVLAVEYLHTYSLIHDDLPAMDNDAWRHGQPTSHRAFGEALAILAGDALLTEAFNKMAELEDSAFSAAHVLHAIRGLAESGGSHGLIAGQVADLAAVHQVLALDQLEAVHGSKTGALFQAACQLPAWLVGDERRAAQLKEFGWHFGLAFQIADDILNVVGDASVMGKSTGTDAALDKATYPKLVGLEQARVFARHHQDLARQALGGASDAAQWLLAVLDRAVNRST